MRKKIEGYTIARTIEKTMAISHEFFVNKQSAVNRVIELIERDAANHHLVRDLDNDLIYYMVGTTYYSSLTPESTIVDKTGLAALLSRDELIAFKDKDDLLNQIWVTFGDLYFD